MVKTKIYHHTHLLSQNLELLENLKKWFNLKFEVIYFYNVYGPRQIKTEIWQQLLEFLRISIKITKN